VRRPFGGPFRNPNAVTSIDDSAYLPPGGKKLIFKELRMNGSAHFFAGKCTPINYVAGSTWGPRSIWGGHDGDSIVF